MDIDVAMAMDMDVAMLGVAVAMDVDVAMLGMAIAMVGMAVVGMVVGLCMVVVVAIAMWGEENGGWRKLNHQHVNVQTSKFNFDT